MTAAANGVDVRIAIIGAGPHGLAAALHLLAADPGLRDALAVVDPSGGWLDAWSEQMARQGIEHLRSPGVHHPGPDPHDLRDWAEGHGHDGSFRFGYALPPTTAFREYCDHLVAEAGLGEHVVPTKARRLIPEDGAATLVLGDGTELTAEHVVVATNPARRCVPPWVFDVLPLPVGALAHAADVDLRTIGTLAGEHVVVVGGGLTSGHLAIGAVERGAMVSLVCRRPLRERMFDTDPGWLGPKHLDAYARLPDLARRVDAALGARDGGTVPPWMARRLHAARDAGQLRVHAPARVCGAQLRADRLCVVLADETRLDADRLWLATGSSPDVTADRLTAALHETHPIPVHKGFAAIDPHLRWPGTSVHLLGRLAIPVLGPAAGNLWGARIGANRIAEHITGRHLWLRPTMARWLGQAR